MRYDKLTSKAQEALQSADSIAHRHDHGTIEVEHLLAALLEQADGVIPPLIERLGVDGADLHAGVQRMLADRPRVYGDAGTAQVGRGLAVALRRAEREAERSSRTSTSQPSTCSWRCWRPTGRSPACCARRASAVTRCLPR